MRRDTGIVILVVLVLGFALFFATRSQQATVLPKVDDGAQAIERVYAASAAIKHGIEWFHWSDVSKIDGRGTDYLSLASSDDPDAALVMRCGNSGVDVFVKTGTVVSSDPGSDYRRVRLRLDGFKPVTERWRESQSGTALFSTWPSSLLNDLVDTKDMVFEFTPHGSIPRELSFGIGDLQKQLVFAPRCQKALSRYQAKK